MILFQSAFAAQIRLAWDPEPGVAGYKVYYGTASRIYGSPIDVGNVTTYALTLTPGQTFFIAVTAYDQFGESGYSGELSAVSLTTSVNPGGEGNVNPSGVTWLSSGQSASISATANSGYTFNGWSGDLSGSANPSSITMNGPRNVTANFAATPSTVSCTVTANPSGLQVTVDGSTYTAPQSFSWVPGSSHTLSVPSPQAGVSGVRYVYASWSDGGAQSHTITVPSSSATYNANLTATQYSLTTSVNPAGAGTVNPSGTTWYSSGQSVSIFATANSGYAFNGWSGDLSGSTNPSSIVMNGPKSITANFLSTKTNSNPKAISTPRTPTGPSKGATGSSYKYFTGGSISGQVNPVEYQFDWNGDGSTDLSSWGSATQSKTWTSAGTYRIRARARCVTRTDIVSSWSNAISVSVVNKSFIQITSPEGSETYVVGTVHPVSWKSGYLNPNGTIYLFYWYDKAWHPIAALPPTATSYTWTIPDKPSGLGSVIPNSRIRSTSIWIGSWVGDRWECWGSSGSFKILYDEWIFTISGGDKGGAAIQFGESTFGGHGISFEWGMFEIEGTYGINADGTMNGTYTIYDLNSVVLEGGNLSGGVNGAVTAMTLRLNKSDGEPLFNMSGVRLIGEPVIPVDWKANISGSVQGTLDSLKIEPYQVGGDIYSRVFEVSGSGSVAAGLIAMEGYFFLTNAISYFPRGNIAYGIYTITGATSETGVFSGSLNPISGTFKFSAASDDGKKYTFTGQIGK